MQTKMTGHNVEVTDAIRQYTDKKLQRIQAHYDKITNINVTFNVEKLDQIAEANIAIPGNTIHAKSISNNMYESIDKLIDKLMRQLSKHKEK